MPRFAVETVKNSPHGEISNVVIVDGDYHFVDTTNGVLCVANRMADAPHATFAQGRWVNIKEVDDALHLVVVQPEIREELAAYAHAAWSGWMVYMFGKSKEQDDGSLLVPSTLYSRWKRQAETPYPFLPVGEQGSDREEADKIIETLNGTKTWIQREP